MRMSFLGASFAVKESTEMSRLKRLNHWVINNRSRIWILIIIAVLMVGCIFVSKLPRYVDMYKYILNAEVSLDNDDLKGALLSFEKAYELVPTELLEQEIERLNQLIKSKSNFLRGEQAEESQNYESAYYYYNEVDSIDEERYYRAQEKLPEIAEKVVESIYEQVEKYYEEHLYLLVIGRLESALKYNIRVDETLEKIDQYKDLLYKYYIDKAQSEALTYFDDPLFYQLFITSIDNALKYAITDEQKEYVLQLKDELIKTNIERYLILVQESHKIGDEIVAKKYIEQILSLDATNKDVFRLLEEISLD